ncbi:MAG: hypothetical protein V1743_03990, partial [Nanoarchaeota archaeon]
TALFLRYVKQKGVIAYADEFIDRITVYAEKDKESAVDERESARYGSSVTSEEIMAKYDYMMDVCRRCISQCEEIIYSDTSFEIPRELIE